MVPGPLRKMGAFDGAAPPVDGGVDADGVGSFIVSLRKIGAGSDGGIAGPAGAWANVPGSGAWYGAAGGTVPLPGKLEAISGSAWGAVRVSGSGGMVAEGWVPEETG